MILGMSTATYTLLHVLISLVGIGSGLIVMFGLLTGKRLDGWTAIFLATTVLTSLSGFAFPVDHLLPSHIVCIISLVVIGDRNSGSLRHAPGWRLALDLCRRAALALYLNVFVAVVFFGISLPVVQVGGGLIVISTGWAMLNQKDENERDSVGRSVNCTNALRDAFYPLTLPLTVGPGSISIAITLGANEPHHLRGDMVAILAAAIGSALLAATIYLCYAFADRLGAMIGPTGMNVMIKLAAFLLVCIGVQILWNGASQLLSSLSAFRS